MPTFFVPPENIQVDTLVITGQDAFHLQKVLRVKKGAPLTVSDGENQVYAVEVVGLEPDRVSCRIVEKKRSETEPATSILLVQSLPKNPKMEWVVQKGVEVGVAQFLPVVTERSILRPAKDKKDKLQSRWQNIAEAAAKQCGRVKVPQVMAIQDWAKALAAVKDMDLVLLPWENEDKTGLKGLLAKRKKLKSIAVLIGPEGGFSLKEVKEAQAVGAHAVTLGPRILRTETAGMVACALILHELGQ